ncbi:MAG TPA: GNAT family N-acetyltransferase [Rubrivivax sp.]|nr:GNAT family N-acetyltransferase [Rubrivivax sp.]
MPEDVLVENGFVGTALPGCLFQSPAFFRLHAVQHGVFFEWVQDGRVLACIHFTPGEAGLWRSPARGTFAGYAWVDELRPEDLFAFHDAVMARLLALGARRVEILPAPMAHDPDRFSQQLYLLRSRGFDITQCDLNQSLEVDGRALAERMSYGNVKRLRKCEREGLVTSALPLSDLPEVHATLSANRASKGHAMSMSLAALQDMASALPDALQLFGCRAMGEMAAAAVCVRLSAEVMYVFCWGDRPGYGSLSPVVPVAQAIYAHCQATGVRQLDVGTSTVDREPNFGLLQFKRGLGFGSSLKLRLARDL